MATSREPPRQTLARTEAPGAHAALVHACPHAALLVDPEGMVLLANPRAHSLLERDPAGHAVLDLFPDRARPILAERLRHAREQAPPEDLDTELALGSQALVSLTFLPLPVPTPGMMALLLRDLTAERARRDLATRAEAQDLERSVRDNRKMIDLGKLIAAVTHEMRTPLTYVHNNLVLSLGHLRHPAPASREVAQPAIRYNEAALDGVERLQRLLQELRPLTKNRPHRNVSMSLADLVVEAVRTFEATKLGETRVELDLESTHPVPIDREDMLNVLANLLNNAAQAMENGGVIRVRTRNRDTPPEIRVSDSGPGVPQAARERLFEPFFTTKQDGTGLGLFISRRTVEAHGGTLTYEESPEGGATFVIVLPTP